MFFRIFWTRYFIHLKCQQILRNNSVTLRIENMLVGCKEGSPCPCLNSKEVYVEDLKCQLSFLPVCCRGMETMAEEKQEAAWNDGKHRVAQSFWPLWWLHCWMGNPLISVCCTGHHLTTSSCPLNTYSTVYFGLEGAKLWSANVCEHKDSEAEGSYDDWFSSFF